MAEPADFQRALDQFSDWRWRLNNLYFITDKDGRRVQFRMNWAQEALFDGMHYQNLILKARQLGFTTFIQLFMLDACVFNSNIRAGTIAHTLNDAQAIFRDKVKYPYDNLPDKIKETVPSVADSASELMLANNSSVRVGTSLRSGTLQYLHVSEYGKLCAKYPEKAKEVRTGALNTVQAGQIVFIESTAEGQGGHYYELCEQAQSKARLETPLTKLDFKFHFYPWWRSPEYAIDPTGVEIPASLQEYFFKLEAGGIKLSLEQKAWYVKKAEVQQDDMKREFPSTPNEAFEAAVEGAYYAEALSRMESEKRITRLPVDRGLQVHTSWDLGYDDSMSIWFIQQAGREIRLIGYYENSGYGFDHYKTELDRRRDEWGISYANHYHPHDVAQHEISTGRSRFDTLIGLGIKPVIAVPRHDPLDGINAVRRMLDRVVIDPERCEQGLKCLRNYRKEWDEDRGVFKNKPLHDWASHGADSLRTFAAGYAEPQIVERERYGRGKSRGRGNSSGLSWEAA